MLYIQAIFYDTSINNDKWVVCHICFELCCKFWKINNLLYIYTAVNQFFRQYWYDKFFKMNFYP